MPNKITCLRLDEGLAVQIDGVALSPDLSQTVFNHSPDGFNIGYGGSGPAQLALAVLLEFTSAKTAVKLHQDFKWEFLAKSEYQEMDVIELEIDIRDWIKAKEA